MRHLSLGGKGIFLESDLHSASCCTSPFSGACDVTRTGPPRHLNNMNRLPQMSEVGCFCIMHSACVCLLSVRTFMCKQSGMDICISENGSTCKLPVGTYILHIQTHAHAQTCSHTYDNVSKCTGAHRYMHLYVQPLCVHYCEHMHYTCNDNGDEYLAQILSTYLPRQIPTS